jgi:hypothetical protein
MIHSAKGLILSLFTLLGKTIFNLVSHNFSSSAPRYYSYSTVIYIFKDQVRVLLPFAKPAFA